MYISIIKEIPKVRDKWVKIPKHKWWDRALARAQLFDKKGLENSSLIVKKLEARQSSGSTHK